jgi:ribosomal protein S18 acetylase RimI-like enzyme
MPAPVSRPLLEAEIAAAAAVIAQAYIDDPLCAFMLPRRTSRLGTLRRFFRAYLTVSVRSGTVLVTGDPVCAVAIWNEPSVGSASISVRSLGAFLPLLATPYVVGLLRARSAIRLQDALRMGHAPKPHAYLDNVAVEPGRRGEGLASALIRPRLAAADAKGMATYTDTFTASNIALYEHLGFRCADKATDARTGLTVWALLRPPA